jgi:hypothetical protein
MIMNAIQAGRTTAPTVVDDSANSDVGSMASGDLGAAIAALAVENGTAERSTSHEARDVEEQAEAQADAAQVKSMRDEASSMRLEGAFDAVTTIGTAYIKAYCPPVGFLGEAGEKLGDGVFHATQHSHEADAAAHRAEADQAKSAADKNTDAAGDADAYVKAAFDFYREYSSTEAQTQSAALHKA